MALFGLQDEVLVLGFPVALCKPLHAPLHLQSTVSLIPDWQPRNTQLLILPAARALAIDHDEPAAWPMPHSVEHLAYLAETDSAFNTPLSVAFIGIASVMWPG